MRAARPELARGVSRNTFAVFLQPDVSFVMRAPRVPDAFAVGAAALGAAPAPLPLKLTAQEASGWRDGQTFGAFAAAVMGQYYREAQRQERDARAAGRRQMLVLHVEAE